MKKRNIQQKNLENIIERFNHSNKQIELLLDLKNEMIFSHENINRGWITYKEEEFVTLYTKGINKQTDIVEITVDEVVIKTTALIEAYQIMRNIID
ncbi:hypothetical protein ACFQOY_12140 [Enterococcus alcedinis]|uniref:Uncharacterized protein n=1 Tax=Enterococcus alcedinis TaxID=1274384 RepID=A0A917N5D3_9ENTE|nr:hypothetical protein [Enterococcus alcedinis]MBP2102490.1 hypothetical protein [Enterococcus alcedinis]GGI65974.1 hypothetical protein GCM10011482_16280 [Enterococcus alcedinis]